MLSVAWLNNIRGRSFIMLDLCISLVFRVDDYGDGATLKPITSEVARSKLYYIPDEAVRLARFIDEAIENAIAECKEDLYAETVKIGKMRIYTLLSHSLLKL